VDADRIRKLLALAKDFASKQTDEGIDRAAEILLRSIDNGCEDPETLVTAASYLLQGSKVSQDEVKKKAASLADKAALQATGNVPVLEKAISCYELILDDYPDKINDIIGLCLNILNSNPNHIESMIILAGHRKHPSVSLSLGDATRMLEWALETEPDNLLVAYSLARLYVESRRYKRARELFQQVLDRGTTEAAGETATNTQSGSGTKPFDRRRRKYSVN
jgi:tetratricopeptide (TPR) repeat protein